MRPPEPPVISEEIVEEIEVNNNALLDGEDLESVEDYVEKVIYVKTKKVGYLIGTAGRTIQGFELNSGAKIDIMKPNSSADETPVLLSGPSESVRNVLRMIIDLYHLNNLSSELWQHLRKNHNVGEIHGHEEIVIPTNLLPQWQENISQMERETGVHVEIGKEREDNPGYIPIGVIGTAEQNFAAMSKLEEWYQAHLNEGQEEVENMSEFNILRSYKENMLLSKDVEISYAILQPICRLNNVTMETLKTEDSVEVVVTGYEFDVKRAKLQLQHSLASV